MRLITAATANRLLTGQLVFSTAFVGACELPNWIQAPRQVNACRSRSKALALFFPSGMLAAIAQNQPALGPRAARGVPMSSPISASDYLEHFKSGLAHHPALLLAVLDRLVAHEFQVLQEGGTLRSLWRTHQVLGAGSPAPSTLAPRPPRR